MKRKRLSRRAFLISSTVTPFAYSAFSARAEAQFLASSLPIQTPAESAAGMQDRVGLALGFISSEMDRWTHGTVVYDDYNSGGMGYVPTGWMGDGADLTVNDAAQDSPGSARTFFRIIYSPKGKRKWAGVFWQYPDRNWGGSRGRDLSGASRLVFRARGRDLNNPKEQPKVEFKIGGVNRYPHHDPKYKFQDSLDSIDSSPAVITLKRDWQTYVIEIPVKKRKLESVIGGFCVVVSATRNRKLRDIEIDIDDVRYDNASPNMLRLIRSYVPSDVPVAPKIDPIRNSAFLYDNALALLAFLAKGDSRRSRLLADALVWAWQHDRSFKGGRWRVAYSSGPLDDPLSKTARLPGWWDPTAVASNGTDKGMWLEDRYAASQDVGASAWAIIALLSAHRILENKNPDSDYFKVALAAANWIESTARANDSIGGYTGGVEGWEESPGNPGPDPITWRSAEHALDLYCAFSKLASLTDKAAWQESAAHAKKFVLDMWNSEKKHFWTGVEDDGKSTNRLTVPLDVQAWAVLSMGHDSEFRRTIGWTSPSEKPGCIAWVEENCRLQFTEACLDYRGYKFSSQGKGLWFEGAAHLAAAYNYLELTARSAEILGEIEAANPSNLTSTQSNEGASVGGIFAACPETADTGFMKAFWPSKQQTPWTYPRKYHLGATAWFVLASLRKNPYWVEGLPGS